MSHRSQKWVTGPLNLIFLQSNILKTTLWIHTYTIGLYRESHIMMTTKIQFFRPPIIPRKGCIPPPVPPVNYQSIVTLIMDPDFHNKTPYWQYCTRYTSPRSQYQKKLQARKNLEDYDGHLNYRNREEEFDLSRGYTAGIHGWNMFCDEVGPFEDIPRNATKILGNLYDMENGLGYIGFMAEINGKPCPIIHYWATLTRLNHPKKGKFGIDKTDAIYDFECKYIEEDLSITMA